MATMNNTYLNAIADHGVGLIDYIGLVDENGTEITGGTPGYERKAVTWTPDGDGIRRPDADIVFDIPQSTTVGGWRGYDQQPSGGTDYGGADLDEEEYTNQGEYKLLAAETGIKHEV